MTAVESISPASERTPLLASTPAITDDGQEPHHHHPSLTPARKNAILLIVSAFVLAIGIGDELISPAQTRVLEAIVCRHYYASHNPSVIQPGHDGWWDDESRRGVLLGVQEKWCKVPQIQGEVAMLKGWQTGLESIGSLVLAVPYGWFADRYGRRPLLIMLGLSLLVRASWQQVVLYNWEVFDVKMMWLSALYSLFGGGNTVAAAVVFTAVTDITTEAERVSTFFRVTASSMATMFISPPISAWLMQRNPWIAMLLGLCVLFLPVPFLGLTPETLHYRSHGSLNPPRPPSPVREHPPGVWQKIRKRVQDAVEHSIGFMASDLRIGFLVLISMLHLLMISGAREVLLQYASMRYAISLSSSTLILSIRAGINLFLLLFMLPAVTNWLKRRPAFQTHPSFADLQLARGSAILMAVGFFAIALAGHLSLYVTGLVINTAGGGLMTYVRSLALSFVDERVTARLFAAMGLMDTIGIMVGAPTLAKLFDLGVSKGHGWEGLPFLACAALVAIASIGLGTMRPGELIKDQIEEDEGEDEALLGSDDDCDTNSHRRIDVDA